jgi:hypothetical protein
VIATTERPTDVRPRITLQRLPRPDYARHPAYGLLFGRPRVSTRIQAFQRLWPFLREQFAPARRQPPRPHLPFETTGEETLYERMSRDGAVGVRLNVDEIAALREYIRPFIDQLRQRKALIPPEKRVFKDMFLSLSAETAPQFIRCLRGALEQHGVLSAASRYLGVGVDMRDVVRLQVTDAHDGPWHDHFGDVGLQDPATTYMHIDSENRFLKCMLYFNEVTQQNGPFAYVLGTNNVEMSRFEYMVRKANDRSRLDKCDAATRELFSALPKCLQLKSEFGNDLLDSSPEAAALIAGEHEFTSEDGHLIVFDNNGVHRGRRVVEGERHGMQIQLRPIASQG